MASFWNAWHDCSDNSGNNIVKVEYMNHRGEEISAFNDNGYEELVNGYLEFDKHTKGINRVYTVVNDVYLLPVFNGQNHVVWEGVTPHIDGDTIYYYELMKTSREIEEFAILNGLKHVGKKFPWPRNGTKISQYKFSVSNIVTNPIFDHVIMDTITDTRISSYAESIELPDDEHEARALRLAILRELYCCMNRRKFAKIARAVVMPDPIMSIMVDSYVCGWESCPYTHSLIDRYIASKSDDLYKKLVFQEIVGHVSEIKMSRSGSDHSVLAEISAVLMRKDYIFNVEEERWMEFNEFTKNWEFVPQFAMVKVLCDTLKEGLIDVCEFVNEGIYTRFSSDLSLTGMEIRNSIESMLQNDIGKEYHARAIISQMKGIKSMNVRGAFIGTLGLTKAKNVVIDFTTGELIIRSPVREDMIHRSCGVSLHREDLESVGCYVGKSTMLDPVPKWDLEMDTYIPHPIYQPTFVKLTDIPLYRMTMKMFWRQAKNEQGILERDLNTSRDLSDEFWKILAKPFTGDLVKIIMHLCGPKGKNGKTTMMQIIATMADEYCKELHIGTLIKEVEGHGHSAGFVGLENAYYATVSEIDSTRPLSARILKNLSGGEKIPIRDAHGHSKKAVLINALIILNGNEPASFDKTDGPLRDRSQYFTALGQFDEKASKSEREQWKTGVFKADPNMSTSREKLVNMANQALFLTAYFGQMYKVEGLKPNEDMEYYKEYFMSNANPQTMFIRECIQEDEDCDLSIQDLYVVFCRWFEVIYRRQGKAPSRDTFVRQLKSSFPSNVTFTDVLYVSFTEAAAQYGDYKNTGTSTNETDELAELGESGLAGTENPSIMSPFDR